MEGTCRTYGEEGEVHTGFWWGNLTERDHLEDHGLDRRIIVLSYVLTVLSCVLFVCKCVLYYCHRVSTQLQLTNMSININIKMGLQEVGWGGMVIWLKYQSAMHNIPNRAKISFTPRRNPELPP
jgi:hypothetical protein